MQNKLLMAKAVFRSSTVYSSAAACMISLIAYFLFPSTFEALDSKIFDLKFRHMKSDAVSGKQIVHLDVDDKTIQEIGPWPWDREIFSRVVDILDKLGARLIVFDILFASVGKSEEGNNTFFNSISASGKVVSSTACGITDSHKDKLLNQSPTRADLLYDRSWPLEIPPKTDLYKVSKLSDSLLPLPEIIRRSRALGHIKSTADRDGVHRSIALMLQLEDRIVPSLSLAAVAAFLNVEPQDISISKSGYIQFRSASGSFEIPINGQSRMVINWRQRWDSFPLGSLIKNKPDAKTEQLFRDKIVIVGVTWTGATDIGLTPQSNETPLSRIHSNAINTILTRSFIYRINPVPVLFFAVAAALVFAIFSRGLKFYHFVAVAIGVGLVLVLAAFTGFAYFHWDLPVSGALIVFSTSSAAAIIARGISSETEGEKIAGALRKYLSPQMLESITKQNLKLDLSTKRKELTVLFADIAGFSAISEEVEVEYVAQFLDDFFDSMTSAVFDNNGTVDKFLGDGLLAFFGDPIELENHAYAAVKTGEQMLKSMRTLNAKWSGMGIKEFENGIHIRIGIATGMMMVGNIGSERRMEYTVVGSTVNLASRLQAIAGIDGILMASRTFALARDRIKCGPLRSVKIKGFDREISVYDLETSENSAC